MSCWLSVVVPARDEEENIDALVMALAQTGRKITERFPAAAKSGWECVIVDDNSQDGTPVRLDALCRRHAWLRTTTIRPPDGSGPRTAPGGQSAALYTGIRCSEGEIVAMLDADLQNDPEDLPDMLERLLSGGVDLVQGDRSKARRDTGVRRFGSAVGRIARTLLLGDTVRDTGCTLRVLRRELALELPLEFRGMHRFIPVLTRDLGFTLLEHPVRHYPRIHGQSKYGRLGFARALPGLQDCFAVRWMRRRRTLRRPSDS